MPARFRVLQVFQITGRGRAVTGDILEGVIRVGMVARPDGSEQKGQWLIGGVEFADNPSSRESHLGLILPDAPPVEDLRMLLPPGTVLVIEVALQA